MNKKYTITKRPFTLSQTCKISFILQWNNSDIYLANGLRLPLYTNHYRVFQESNVTFSHLLDQKEKKL